jgi:sulfonate transport system substrate-binding protein
MTDDPRDQAARRRTLALLLAGAAGTLAWPGGASAATSKTLRIGYQKYGTLTLLKGRGLLEQRLAPLGVTVHWSEFPSGPVLLEALNVGAIDFGTVGEAPPIFAQAAGADFVYVANEPPSPSSEAIVVPNNSPLRLPSDLRGKKIALNKGSNVHYLLVKALEKEGIAYRDITPVYLAPADARAAFERGSVDAWVIWDPFLAAAERQLKARILADGKGLVANHQFYLAARAWAAASPELVRIVVEELGRVDEWGRSHQQEVAAILTAQTGLEADVVALAAQRFTFGARAVTPDVLRAQQGVADAFAALKLIPVPLSVAAARLPYSL